MLYRSLYCSMLSLMYQIFDIIDVCITFVDVQCVKPFNLSVIMQLSVLVDNFADSQSGVQCEHGLSFFFRCGGRNFLLDVGATSLFAENACRLGVDISAVDYLILSHAHADHTGGLSAFFALNSKAKVYLSSHVCGKRFYSTRRGGVRDISIDASLLELYKDRFVFVDDNLAVTDCVSLLCNVALVYPLPMANDTLLADGVKDDFSHELSVCVTDGDGVKVLSPCSHCGLMNILNAVPGGDVTHFVGGLHLLDSDEMYSFESEAEVRRLARRVASMGIKLYTGHCTGSVARRIFSEEMGDCFAEFRAGDIFSF